MSKAGERLLAAAREMREGAWAGDGHVIFVVGGKARHDRPYTGGRVMLGRLLCLIGIHDKEMLEPFEGWAYLDGIGLMPCRGLKQWKCRRCKKHRRFVDHGPPSSCPCCGR